MGREERRVDKVEERKGGQGSVRGWTRWRNNNNNGAPALTVGVVGLKGAVLSRLIIITLVQGMRSCVPHLTLPSPWLATAPVSRPTSDLLDITTGRVSEGERRRWWTIIFRTLTVVVSTCNQLGFENFRVCRTRDFANFLSTTSIFLSENLIEFMWEA